METKYDIEDDDKDLPPAMQISRKWIAKNCGVIDPQFHQEEARLKKYRKAAAQGGHYATMDGRYHTDAPNKTTEQLAEEHAERTWDRRPCRFFMRGYCNKGNMCTMAHRTRDDAWNRDDEEECKYHYRSCNLKPSKARRVDYDVEDPSSSSTGTTNHVIPTFKTTYWRR